MTITSTLLRLHRPLEPFLTKRWRATESDLVKLRGKGTMKHTHKSAFAKASAGKQHFIAALVDGLALAVTCTSWIAKEAL